MNIKRNFPEPVEALLLIITIFGLILLVSSLIILGRDGALSTGMNADETLRLFFVFGGLFFLLVPLLYAGYKKYPVQPLFRFRGVPLPVIFYSLVLGLSVTVLSDELDRLINLVFPIPDWMLESMQPLKVQTPLEWVMVIFGAVLIAALSEEALFRGFLQNSLEAKGDVNRAVVLSSVSWTMIHMNPYWAIQIFITGMILGFLAWRTDSIIPGTLVHGLNNLLAILFFNLKLDELMLWYEFKGHVAPALLVICAALLVYALRGIQKQYQAG